LVVIGVESHLDQRVQSSARARIDALLLDHQLSERSNHASSDQRDEIASSTIRRARFQLGPGISLEAWIAGLEGPARRARAYLRVVQQLRNNGWRSGPPAPTT
jgi:hypothetical protein